MKRAEGTARVKKAAAVSANVRSNAAKDRGMTHVFVIRTRGPESHELLIDGEKVPFDFFDRDAAAMRARFIASEPMVAANIQPPHQAASNLEFALVSQVGSMEVRRAVLVLPDRT
jgi:hypothetical protein